MHKKMCFSINMNTLTTIPEKNMTRLRGLAIQFRPLQFHFHPLVLISGFRIVMERSSLGNKKISRLIKLIAIILFLSNHCAKDSQEEYKKLNIYCVLNNDAKIQRVIVDRTYGMDEPSEYDLDDVQVILVGSGQCDTLIEESEKRGFFMTADSFQILPGQSYELEVRAKDFETVYGTTLIPDSFRIVSPNNGDTVDHLSDTLVIMKDYPSQLFRIGFIDSTGNYIDCLWWGREDTTFVRVPFAHILYGEMGICCRYTLKISVPDSNFYQYEFSPADDSIRGYGIKNGIGVFGSVWTEKREIFVRF